MRYGSCDYQYELVDNWGDLPEGFEWHQVAGVAVDSSDNVYAYNRSAHQMMVFDRSGGFLSTWDETFAGPHGIHIGPDDCVYLADRDAHLISQVLLGWQAPPQAGYRTALGDRIHEQRRTRPPSSGTVQPAHRDRRDRRG